MMCFKEALSNLSSLFSVFHKFNYLAHITNVGVILCTEQHFLSLQVSCCIYTCNVGRDIFCWRDACIGTRSQFRSFSPAVWAKMSLSEMEIGVCVHACLCVCVTVRSHIYVRSHQIRPRLAFTAGAAEADAKPLFFANQGVMKKLKWIGDVCVDKERQAIHGGYTRIPIRRLFSHPSGF